MRDYRKERLQYYGYGSKSACTPLQRRHRQEMRNRQIARATLKRTQPIRANQDVHHKNGNPLDNRRSNLAVISRATNRSMNAHKTNSR